MRLRFAIVLTVLVAVIALPGVSFGATMYYPPAQSYTPADLPPSGNTNQNTQGLTSMQAQRQAQGKNPFGLTAPTYVPAGVNSSGVYVTPETSASKAATATYNLDWTIGTTGKSGCLVCHGDQNLYTIVNGRRESLYVSTLILTDSAHAKLLCTDCHVDFAYKTPHPTVAQGDEWKAIAKSSCKNCHRNEYLDWAKSAHSTAGTPGETSTVGAADSSAPGKPRPLCGDCHGGHAIPSKDDTAAQAALHASGLTMCGGCHVQWAASYDDYYHGAAYKRGAADAPACWQCHNTHLILQSNNRDSWTFADKLPATCGQCHKSVNDSATFIQYAQLVHRKDATLSSNPVVEIANSARQAISNVIYQVTHMFGNKGSS